MERRRPALGRIFDEDELGFGAHELFNQPGAGSPVDVAAGSGGPPHAPTSTVDARSSTTLIATPRSGGGKWSRWVMRWSSRRSLATARPLLPGSSFPAASAASTRAR